MSKNNPETSEFRKMADLLSDLSREYKYRGFHDIAESLMDIVINLHEQARLREENNIKNSNNNTSQEENHND